MEYANAWDMTADRPTRGFRRRGIRAPDPRRSPDKFKVLIDLMYIMVVYRTYGWTEKDIGKLYRL